MGLSHLFDERSLGSGWATPRSVLKSGGPPPVHLGTWWGKGWRTGSALSQTLFIFKGAIGEGPALAVQVMGLPGQESTASKKAREFSVWDQRGQIQELVFQNLSCYFPAYDPGLVTSGSLSLLTCKGGIMMTLHILHT